MPTALSVMLCAGAAHALPHASVSTRSYSTPTIPTIPTISTVDLNPRQHPTVVGDVRTVHRRWRRRSVDLLVFHHCPWPLVHDPSTLAHWLSKVKRGGYVVWYGPSRSVSATGRVAREGQWLWRHVHRAHPDFEWRVTSEGRVAGRRT